MALFLLNDTQLWVSKRRETSFNTPYTAGADFEKVRSNSPVAVLPNIEFRTDAGQIGNGHEFATLRCPTYVQHPGIPVADFVNNEILGRILLRGLGGTVVNTSLASPAEKHVAPMLPVASGRQLPTSTIVSMLAAADVRLDGCVVERIKMSQTGADPCLFEADFIGSGKFVTPNAVASLPADASIIPCLDGNFTELKWTDAGGVRDFTAGEGFRNASFEVVNNSKVNDRRAGDGTVTLTYESVTVNPAYVRAILRGSRVVNASITIPLQATKPEWEKYVIGQALTDVTFRARGAIITGAVRQSMAMIIPKAKIASITTGEDGGDAVQTITLDAMYDSVSGGAVLGEVVNITATNYD